MPNDGLQSGLDFADFWLGQMVLKSDEFFVFFEGLALLEMVGHPPLGEPIKLV
jgi:hypothetical protein